MELLVTVSDYGTDLASQYVWTTVSADLRGCDGLAYYKHPLLRAAGMTPPELTGLARGWRPFSIRVLGSALESVESVDEGVWTVGGETKDSPVLETDDFVEALYARFQQHRALRNLLRPGAFVALPNIERRLFQEKFPGYVARSLLFRNEGLPSDLRMAALADGQWSLARSVFQSAAIPGAKVPTPSQPVATKGQAVRLLNEDLTRACET